MLKTRKYYSCLLPNKLGGFIGLWLRLYHHRIKFGLSQKAKIETLNNDAIYVYVTKYKSRFTFLFTFLRFKKLGLPYPTLGLDFNMLMWQPVSHVIKFWLANIISLLTTLKLRNPYKSGFIKRQLLNGKTAMLPLIGEKSFRRRFIKRKTDPLQYLIELQRETGKTVYLVPILPILNKDPNRRQRDLFHPILTKDAPTNMFWRFIPIMRGKAFFEVADPVVLNDYLVLPENTGKTTEDLANNLRNQMIETINLHRQGITGPSAKNRQEIKEQILTSEHFMDFMKSYAESKNMKLADVHKSAEGYLDEIAADFSSTVAKIAYHILRSIFKIMFNGIVVNQEGLDAAKAASRKGPLVFIPCHRSHIDYLVLSYIYYKNDLSVPLIAAGKNLSIWPIGPLFRKCGAFFIRRSFHGAVLYANVFSEYVYTILKEGHNVEQFIEGGRSRTGKLLTPKLGMLTILLNSIKENHCKDLTVVPVFIGYDRVVEEKSYLKEVKGGQKNPENFSSLLRASTFLAKKHGAIYIQMADPVSVQSLAQQRNVDITALQGRDYTDFVSFVGNKVINEINHITITTPFAVTASAILNYSKPMVTFSEIKIMVEAYLRYLAITGAPVADSLIKAPDDSIKSAINAYMQRKFIAAEIEDKKNPPPMEDWQFNVKYNRRAELDYYRNNCITAFVPLAFTSMAILTKAETAFEQEELMETYLFLKNLFRLEFIRDIDSNSPERMNQALQFLLGEELVMQNSNGAYTITEEAFPTLRAFASFILPVLETYLVALTFFSNNKKAAVKARDAARHINSLGEKMLNNHELLCREALSKITIQNAVDVFVEDKLNNPEHIAEIQPVLGRLANLVHTLH